MFINYTNAKRRRRNTIYTSRLHNTRQTHRRLYKKRDGPGTSQGRPDFYLRMFNFFISSLYRPMSVRLR